MDNVNDILVCLNGLPSLKSLYLSYNRFHATSNGEDIYYDDDVVISIFLIFTAKLVGFVLQPLTNTCVYTFSF